LGACLKILSLNCNGIRSATSKGLHEFLQKEDFDILCFQEIKANFRDIDLGFYKSMKYHEVIFSAEKKGYSGTAVFSKSKFLDSKKGINHTLFDGEGRVITLHFQNFIMVNTYFPSGTSGEERQTQKMIFLDTIQLYLGDLKKSQTNIILTGDINIAHREVDIHDPKGNKKNSGFLPEEREWIDKLLESGWVDGFRQCHPNAKDIYTWWTYRFSSRSKNKGWRIDSFFLTENLKKNIKECNVYTDKIFSDHAPIYLELSGVE
jgi:exodeoxyribonuclease-3